MSASRLHPSKIWLRGLDSNQDSKFQRLADYLYPTPQQKPNSTSKRLPDFYFSSYPVVRALPGKHKPATSTYKVCRAYWAKTKRHILYNHVQRHFAHRAANVFFHCFGLSASGFGAGFFANCKVSRFNSHSFGSSLASCTAWVASSWMAL
jgi:hypothetical protein